MANVVHVPSPNPQPPFGFGFAKSPTTASMVAGWPSPSLTPGHTNPGPFQQLASSMNQPSPLRVAKRRHEPDDDENIDIACGRIGRDHSMDRSPTPERPKRAAPKKAKFMEHGSKEEKKATKANKSKTSGNDGSDVDVGVLLASLPPQSLLPLFTALLSAQPSLKSTILPLIPRPTLDTAIQALAQSAKKLRDAYPFSNASAYPFSHAPVSTLSQSTGFGFGSSFGSKSSVFSSSSVGFGRLPQTVTGHSSSHGGMRDDYIISRLRPHINDFVSACMSYLPYFSYIPSSRSESASAASPSLPQSHSNALQSLHKDKSHPSETFQFLSALTNHLISQPQLAQLSLAPLLLPRLAEEWKAWVDRVDEVVNREGGMFGGEMVRSWEKDLDYYVSSQSEASRTMREIRDRWAAKVGWLVGKSRIQSMEEEL